MQRGLRTGLLALAVCAFCAAPAQGQPWQLPLSRAAKLGATRADGKIHHRLRAVIDELHLAGVTARNARARGARGYSTPFLRVDDRARVKMIVQLAPGGPAALARLATLPLEIQRVQADRNLVQILVPFDVVDDVAALEDVARIRPPGPKLRRAGSITTQGDVVLNADAARLLGLDGSGVTVAVMSDGVAGVEASVASGDLPAGGDTSCGAAAAVDCRCALSFFGPMDGAEGTAMLEIVHDLAPGATLAFGNFDTTLDFAAVIGCLAAPGAVLVDDIIFLAEPAFEDGIVAQAVDTAVATGAVFFSAAGNDAGEHVETTYSDLTPGADEEAFPPSGLDFHDFGGGDASLTVRVNPGGRIFPTLHWDEEYGAASQDYDLYIYDDTFPGTLNVLDASIAPQEGTDDPVEIAVFENTGTSPVTVHVVVDEFLSTADRLLKLHLFGASATVVDVGFLTPTREIYGHTAAAGAMAVGAVPWFAPEAIEPFSSRGPVQILFPVPELRAKPDVVATDGVAVTGNGGFGSTFFGTSAAAPHAAAVAALLLQANPTMPPELVRAVLEDGAVDLGASGRDDSFGAGRVDALAAIDSAPAPQAKDQQSCINALNKNLARVAAAQAKAVGTCVAEGAKGTLGAQTIEACLTADNGGRVAKSETKTITDTGGTCTASPPTIGATDATTVNAVAIQLPLDLIHATLAADLDAAITSAADPARSRCQQAVTTMVLRRCQDVRLREFNRCKKTGLGDGSVQRAGDLAGCIGHDPRGKVARVCVDRVRARVDAKCVVKGVDLATAFPAIGVTDASAFVGVIDQRAECLTCLALNAADALERDCDAADDSQPNGSCPGGLASAPLL